MCWPDVCASSHQSAWLRCCDNCRLVYVKRSATTLTFSRQHVNQASDLTLSSIKIFKRTQPRPSSGDSQWLVAGSGTCENSPPARLLFRRSSYRYNGHRSLALFVVEGLFSPRSLQSRAVAAPKLMPSRFETIPRGSAQTQTEKPQRVSLATRDEHSSLYTQRTKSFRIYTIPKST